MMLYQYFDCLVQDRSIASTLEMGILQSCTKQPIYEFPTYMQQFITRVFAAICNVE